MNQVHIPPSIVDTEEKKAAVYSAISGLVNHAGWNILKDILEGNVKSSQDYLASTKFSDLRDVDEAQNIIGIFSLLIGLPSKLLEVTEASEAVASYDGDPYDKIDPEITEPNTIKE